MRRCGASLLCLVALWNGTGGQTKRDGTQNQPVADTILVGGKIWAGPNGDSRAEALAIWRGRILAVGATSDIEKLASEKTRVIQLGGKLVLPGFHDSHVHLLGAGTQLSQVSLRDAKDESEFGERIRQFDQKLPRDRWLLGGSWDHDRTFRGRLPTAKLLDRYAPERPVFLRRYDGHMALANTRALRLAGIDVRSADPPGGVIYRDETTHEPTGILRDNAMELVARLVPPPSEGEVGEAVRAALSEAARLGVTSVEDMDGGPAIARRYLLGLYQRLNRAGQLSLRIQLYWPLAEWKELANLGIRQGFGDDWVRVGALKGFADGSLGSSTAKMYEPYINEPGSKGVWVTPPGKMREYVLAADRAGLQVAVHAIGDEANGTMLDIYAEAARENGPRDRRFRIEHAQHLRPADYGRFANLGVIPSMQPFHVVDDGRWAEGRIGPERCSHSWAYRELADHSARLAFGSDWPVVTLSPLAGIHAAVNRRTLDGKHPEGWYPAQRITVPEAIEAYTSGAAYATFREHDLGSLERGKLADLVVLSRDILSPSERDHIAETKVLLTMVGGRIVYESKEK